MVHPVGIEPTVEALCFIGLRVRTGRRYGYGCKKIRQGDGTRTRRLSLSRERFTPSKPLLEVVAKDGIEPSTPKLSAWRSDR